MCPSTESPDATKTTGAPSSTRAPSFAGLGIRGSLLLGFGAMCAVIVLAAATALFSMAKVGEPIQLFVEDRLPTTIQTLRVARTVDALAAIGSPLATASSEKERREAFLQLDNATAALEAAMKGLAQTDAATHDIQRLAGLLTRNLDDLRLLVDQRIDLLKVKRAARERLLENLQAFKRSLIYRVRILQGDNEIIRRLIARPSPPMDRIVAMAQSSAQLLRRREPDHEPDRRGHPPQRLRPGRGPVATPQPRPSIRASAT